MDELEQLKCIAVENEVELIPLNFGIIASYYYINTTTIENFSKNIREDSKLKNLLEVITSATEFEDIPIRHGEESVLRNLNSEFLYYKLEKPNYNEPSIKANILLQCHFNRTELSSDFVYD